MSTFVSKSAHQLTVEQKDCLGRNLKFRKSRSAANLFVLSFLTHGVPTPGTVPPNSEQVNEERNRQLACKNKKRSDRGPSSRPKKVKRSGPSRPKVQKILTVEDLLLAGLSNFSLGTADQRNLRVERHVQEWRDRRERRADRFNARRFGNVLPKDNPAELPALIRNEDPAMASLADIFSRLSLREPEKAHAFPRKRKSPFFGSGGG